MRKTNKDENQNECACIRLAKMNCGCAIADRLGQWNEIVRFQQTGESNEISRLTTDRRSIFTVPRQKIIYCFLSNIFTRFYSSMIIFLSFVDTFWRLAKRTENKWLRIVIKRGLSIRFGCRARWFECQHSAQNNINCDVIRHFRLMNFHISFMLDIWVVSFTEDFLFSSVRFFGKMLIWAQIIKRWHLWTRQFLGLIKIDL